MKEHPILFSSPMIRAILEGRKTMTRRVIKPQPSVDDWPSVIPCGMYAPTKVDRHGEEYPGADVYGFANENEGWVCPYGQPGDRLWVRECFAKTSAGFVYKADNKTEQPYWSILRWRPSIHMPRMASRITLEVVGVKVEQVQEITYKDCEAEGLIHGARGMWSCPGTEEIFKEGIYGFKWLWDSINAKRGYGWSVNPRVWVISFKTTKLRSKDGGCDEQDRPPGRGVMEEKS